MRDEIIIHQNQVSSCILFDDIYKVARLVLNIALLRLDENSDSTSVHVADLTYGLPQAFQVFVKTSCYGACMAH
jgi:hypothetical protein